jgi:hypothetical protein
MADTTWVDLPAEILFLVFLVVSRIPRNLMVCRGIWKRFREYLDSVDGVFWRKAAARAYSWWWFKRPAARILYIWKKGTYADPVASFLDAHHRNGPPFVKHVAHLFESCLPGGFLVRSPPSSSPMDKTETLYSHLRLESLSTDQWRGLYWDFLLLSRAAAIYPALNGCKGVSYFERYFPGDREKYLAGADHFVLPVLLGPFDWLRPGQALGVDVLNSHLVEVLKSAGFPEVLVSHYEAVVVSTKRDFSQVAFDLGCCKMGIHRGEDPSKPFVKRLRHIYDDIGVVNFEFGYDNLFSSRDEFGRFHPPPNYKDLFLEAIKDFPRAASELYRLLVENLGPLFSIRPRADCAYETFVSLPRLHLFVSPFSGRLIGVHESFCDEKFSWS